MIANGGGADTLASARARRVPCNARSPMKSSLAIQPAPRSLVLLVGRHGETIQPLADALSAQGYDIRVARTRRQALDALAEAPHLVIAEHALPRMDGVGLVRALRGDERGKGIPLFLVAARRTEELEERALRAGAGMVLGAPLDVEQVVTLVRFAT